VGAIGTGQLAFARLAGAICRMRFLLSTLEGYLLDLLEVVEADEASGRAPWHALRRVSKRTCRPGWRATAMPTRHFPPDRASAILADAVRKRRGIAVVEAVDRRALPIVLMLVQAAATSGVAATSRLQQETGHRPRSC